MLLRGQAGRKQAEELARKSSNQNWRNAEVGVCGNDCPCRRPVVFSAKQVRSNVLNTARRDVRPTFRG